MAIRVRVDDVRFSKLFLFHPGKPFDPNGAEKYSGHGILPKDSPQIAKVKEAIVQVAKQAWGADWEQKLKAISASGRVWCLRDGDGAVDKDGKSIPAYVGNMYVAGKNTIRPSAFGPNQEPLEETDGKPYSGSYGSMVLEIKASDKPQPQIFAKLCGVQFRKDGDRLSGGGVAAADDFEAIPGTEAAATPGAQTASSASALF